MENQNYVLSDEVIQIAKGSKKIRTSLALALKAPDKEIDEWLELNSPHGKLQTVRGIDVLQKETLLPPNKILVAVPKDYIQAMGRTKRIAAFVQ